jgi:hypothetical protein
LETGCTELERAYGDNIRNMELFERITTMTSHDLGRSCTPTFAKKAGAIKLRMVPTAYDSKMMEFLLISVPTIQDQDCGSNGLNR